VFLRFCCLLAETLFTSVAVRASAFSYNCIKLDKKQKKNQKKAKKKKSPQSGFEPMIDHNPCFQGSHTNHCANWTHTNDYKYWNCQYILVRLLIKKHPIGCFLLLLSIFFFTFLLLLFDSSNEHLMSCSEETIRARALKFILNVGLMYTHIRKEFSDLDLDSLWMTLTTCFQLWALITLWIVNRFEIFFSGKLELEKVYK